MPEVRLAWRAAVCYGSPRGQVVVGVAPLSELGAMGSVYPPERVRRHSGPEVPDLSGRARPCAGLAADRDTLVVIPVADTGAAHEWDALLTFAVCGEDEVRRFSTTLAEAESDAPVPFVAAIGLSPEDERELFAGLARSRAADLAELRRRVSQIAPAGGAG